MYTQTLISEQYPQEKSYNYSVALQLEALLLDSQCYQP